MQEAKIANSEIPQSDAKIVERLAIKAKRERQAIGYPELTGNINYSHEVRNLAVMALHEGIGFSEVATAAKVTTRTIRNWHSQTKNKSFRELKIVPAKGEEPAPENFGEKLLPQKNDSIFLEFLLPSGVRVLINRRDLDASLFAIFMGSKGV